MNSELYIGIVIFCMIIMLSSIYYGITRPTLIRLKKLKTSPRNKTAL